VQPHRADGRDAARLVRRRVPDPRALGVDLCPASRRRPGRRGPPHRGVARAHEVAAIFRPHRVAFTQDADGVRVDVTDTATGGHASVRGAKAYTSSTPGPHRACTSGSARPATAGSSSWRRVRPTTTFTTGAPAADLTVDPAHSHRGAGDPPRGREHLPHRSPTGGGTGALLLGAAATSPRRSSGRAREPACVTR
jgi:hypothetical protein